ncbi:MAG: hypothetical protein HKO93_00610, partial [Flavobacteriales bacterium]|nr:hypothetical protein [Flavobacteriales bacterium]
MKKRLFLLSTMIIWTSSMMLAIGPDKQMAKVKGIISEHFSNYASGKMLFVDVNSQEMYVMNKNIV